MKPLAPALFLRAVLAAACFSCAAVPAAPNKPLWAANPSAVFPAQRYVSAVGAGGERQAAEAAAAAALASYFRQSVSNRVSIHDRAGEFDGVFTSELSHSVETSAVLDALIGVEIKETWYDGSGGTGWWAAAVMEKSRGREAYSAELDKAIAAAYRGIDFLEGFEFDRPVRYAGALALLGTAETYTAIVRLLDGPDRRDEIERLAAAVHDAASRALAVTVDIQVAGDRGGRIKGAFSYALAGLGYRVGGRPRYVLKAAVSTEPAPRGRYFNTRYTIEAVITDSRGGSEQFAYHVQGRESHITSQGEADNRAILGASARIREEFPLALRDYFGLNPKHD